MAQGGRKSGKEQQMRISLPKIHRLLVIGAAALLVTTGEAADFTIRIQNFSFIPASQTVAPGDTVTWMNEDAVAHTSTSGTPGNKSGMWDSGALANGQSFSHTFDAAGTFDYFCEFHTFMRGMIIVTGGQSAGPSVSISSPTNNASIAAPGMVTIEAMASSDAGISKVEFFDGTSSLGADSSMPFSVTVTLPSGSHSLTAVATDANGATATAGAVTVMVASGGGTKIDDPIPQRIPKGDITIDLQLVADGFPSPTGMAVPDDGSGRMFVYDQTGLVYVVSSNGVMSATPLLDVRDRLVKLNPRYDERGLVGLATHPDFANHPFIYTHTSEPNGPAADFPLEMPPGATNDHQTVITEWKIDSNDPNRVDPSSRRELLRIDHPQGNHNGGDMAFGADGLLYFAIGDGGMADDQGPGHSPQGNAQDLTKILGAVSRIDVDARTSPNGQYGIPADNPLVGQSGVVQEIYAYGLRNPYSFSFDRMTGGLYLADAGQNKVEEADLIQKGGNYGWHIKEGSFFFDPNGDGPGFVTTAPVTQVPPDLIDPIVEFDHDEGDVIVGGYGLPRAADQRAGRQIRLRELGQIPGGRWPALLSRWIGTQRVSDRGG